MKPRIIVFFLMSGLFNDTLAAACSSNITIVKHDSLYANNADGTITDNETGLMWQQCSLGLTGNECNTGTALVLTWQAALAAANVNTDNGYDDWRLPNKNELESLLEGGCYDPAINEAMFPNTQPFIYWSSSPYVGTDNSAWVVNFSDGGVFRYNKKYGSFYSLARLVRGSN